MHGKVIVTDLTTAKKPGRGKVTPEWFFPPFFEELEKVGLSTNFATSSSELNECLVTASMDEPVLLIHLFNEEQPLGELAEFAGPLRGVTGVFNPPEIVAVIERKSFTNRFLSDAGIDVPEIANGAYAGFTVFSNAETASHAPVQAIPMGEPLSADRYNTRLIDTRRTFRGRSFYTSIRLVCVGSTLVASMVRIRDEAEGDPSVHNTDAPLDAEAITYFQQALVDDRILEWRALARRLGEILPPAFFAHDIVIESENDRPYVCEVGLKFNDYSFLKHLTPVADHLPTSLRTQFSHEFPRRSARAFIRECISRGWLQPAFMA